MNRKLDKRDEYRERRQAALAELQAIEEEEAAADREAAAADLANAANDLNDSGDSGEDSGSDSGDDSGVEDSGQPPAAIVTDADGNNVPVPASEPGAVGSVTDVNGVEHTGELPVDATIPPVAGQPAVGESAIDAPATEETPVEGDQESSNAVAPDAPVAEQLEINPEATEPAVGETFQEEADAISNAEPDPTDVTIPPVEDIIPDGAPIDLTTEGDADAALPVTEPTGDDPSDVTTPVQETKDAAAAADEALAAQPDGTGPIA